MPSLRQWLLLFGLIIFFFAVNFFIINGASLRKREGSAKKQVSSGKKMVRLIALLFTEIFVLMLGFFSLAYVVSFNSTLICEGSVEAIMESLHSRAVAYEKHNYYMEIGELFYFYYLGTDQCIQATLYDAKWEQLQDYIDWPTLLMEDGFKSEPKETLKKARAAKEEQIPTILFKLPDAIAKLIVFFGGYVSVEFRIPVLPLLEHLDRMFNEQPFEYSVRVVFKQQPFRYEYDDEEEDRIGYFPLAVGEKQIAQLDETLYDKEKDVYYLHSRSKLPSQLTVAYNVHFFREAFPWAIFGFLFLLIMSIATQSALSSVQERKHAQQQLEHIRNYTHDMKTPLAILWQYSDQVNLENFPPGERELMGKIKIGLQDMARRVQGILEYMRQGVGTLRLDEFSLRDLAEDCLLEVSPLLEDKGVKWALDGGADMQVEADKSRMEQAIRNFFSNAVKHTPKGGRVEARVTQEKKKRVRVTVFNSGEGIPKDEQKKIWEMFYSLEGGGDNALRGTGIGLAMVRDTAARHRGSSNCRNVDGGVEFWIEIPKRQKKKRGCPMPQKRSSPKAKPGPTRRFPGG